MDRTGAESIRNTKLFLPKSELPKLPEGAYYDWQLKGLMVQTESGKPLGEIETILYNPTANDVYETSLALIPAHAQFVLSVDLETGQMVVSDDPGLLK
jgi:16S rRNA processing protein RimM